MSTSAQEHTFDEVASHSLPRYNELPSFGVYVDQLVTFVNSMVDVYYLKDEKVLTASMVNNYVKQGVVPKPEKKKYSRNHIAYLMVVCVLKKVFSIQEITELVDQQIAILPTETAYNAFVEQLECSIKRVFSEDMDTQGAPIPSNDERFLVERAVSTFSNKVFVQKHLELTR